MEIHPVCFYSVFYEMDFRGNLHIKRTAFPLIVFLISCVMVVLGDLVSSLANEGHGDRRVMAADKKRFTENRYLVVS